MTDPRIGTVVGGRFELHSKVGEGGMGLVYKAKDKTDGSEVAVKFLHAQFMEKEEFVARFRQEGRSASRFRHPNAVRIIGGGEDDEGIPWLAMEYCAGRSLKRLLAESGQMPVSRVASIGKQILDALAEAHKNGIIHRDLKPENIKVETDPEGADRVKVLDFGVAKFIGTEEVAEMTGAVKTQTGVVFGTPKYMAPEQILGEPVDGRSDIYAVGAMLYEMLAGVPPFPSDDIMGFITKHLKEPAPPFSVRAPDRRIPSEFEALVLEMLAKDRSARPARAGDVSRRLEAFVAGAGEGAAPAGLRRLLFLVYVVAAIVGGGLAAAVTGSTAAAAVSVALGLGAAAACMACPRIGEGAFFIRALIVTVVLSVGAAVAAFGLGAPGWLTVGLAVAALLVFVLFSAGWGRREPALAFLLGGIVAPLLAIPLLPFPEGEGYRRVWQLGSLDAATLGPAVAVLAIAVAFSASAFVVPPPGERSDD